MGRTKSKNIARERKGRRARKRERAARPPEGPVGFLMAPLSVESKASIKGKTQDFAELRKIYRDVGASRSPDGMDLPKFLEKAKAADRRGYGLVLHIDRLHLLSKTHPAGIIFHNLFRSFFVGDPERTRKAQLETLKIIRQVRELGHEVRILDPKDKRHEPYIRAAVGAGAVRMPVHERQVADEESRRRFLPGTTWARDQYVKIDGKKERPMADMASIRFSPERRFFGEGGTVVQVGPKEYAIAEDIMEDPRIARYEKKGYKFHPMPDSIAYHSIMSDLFGQKMYSWTNHIDLNIGGIPEKKIIAVDPRYYSEHRLSVQMLRDNHGLKMVEVPTEEADRHPANFLPLGNGRVLVDSGAPKFIERLREAGAEVIPTAVPVDHLITQRGGLHCLFNEL
jgi:hypothetical protein